MNEQEWIDRGKEVLLEYGPKVLGALLILVIGYVLAKLITAFARRVMERTRMDGALIPFLSGLVYMLLMALVIIAAISKLGVNTTSFAAVMAAAGLAIGLALQGSLSNFAAGVMILFRRPFTTGDFVEVAGTSGNVESISIFSTELTTPDNKRIIVPNGKIIDDLITNYNVKPTRRIDLEVGISYDDDLRHAKEVLERILRDEGRVLDEPPAQVAVSGLGDSSVKFVVRPWVRTEDYWAARFAIIEAIKTTFDVEGISLPFPQQEVHYRQVEGKKGGQAAGSLPPAGAPSGTPPAS